MLSMTTMDEPNLFGSPTLPAPEPPGSPVKTDLVLGQKHTESNQANDFVHYISSLTMAKTCDDDEFNNTYKKLVESLLKMVWWQVEAASTVASAIAKWKSGNGKRLGTRGDMWLLFTGPDRAGKKKMANIVAELVCEARLITISLGTQKCDQEVRFSSRGKTVIDQIAEAIQRNPFSMIMIEDIDQMDVVVCRSINRAIESGRFVDSHGHEISLGNIIFVLTGDWSAFRPETCRGHRFVDETKLRLLASGSWRIGLVVREKNSKRHSNWPVEDRNIKPRKDDVGLGLGLSLDLGLATINKTVDRSHSSTEVQSIASVPYGLIRGVDESVEFKPVELDFAMQEINKAISLKFTQIMDAELSLEVNDDVLERILGGLWHDHTSLDEWIDNVLEPNLDQLKSQMHLGDGIGSVVRLVVEANSSGGHRNGGEWLPSSISV